MTLEDKLKPLRKRYKIAGEDERKWILKAVKQYRREYGVDKTKGQFDVFFETANEIFGKI